jgi:hypothetical protein
MNQLISCPAPLLAAVAPVLWARLYQNNFSLWEEVSCPLQLGSLACRCPWIKEIVIVCDSRNTHHSEEYTEEKIRFAPPGATRQGSVQQGLLRASPGGAHM